MKKKTIVISIIVIQFLVIVFLLLITMVKMVEAHREEMLTEEFRKECVQNRILLKHKVEELMECQKAANKD